MSPMGTLQPSISSTRSPADPESAGAFREARLNGFGDSLAFRLIRSEDNWFWYFPQSWEKPGDTTYRDN